jgi:hypothetical protein
MIDLSNISEFDAPLYAYDFRARTLLTFDGKEVTGLAQPIRKVWSTQSTASFLSAIKPLVFWSNSPYEAASAYVFARKGTWLYRFSKVDYFLARKNGLKGVFGHSEFTDPDSLANLSTLWFFTVIEAWQAY